MVRSALSCALLGGFAIGARVSLLLQHNPNAKCQRVLLLALCLVIVIGPVIHLCGILVKLSCYPLTVVTITNSLERNYGRPVE